MRLMDKVAIVTGGASGLGAGIVRRFVAEGAQVLIADRDFDRALALAAAVGPAARAQQIDAANAEDVRRMAETAVLHFGRIDILVNGAGLHHSPDPLGDTHGAGSDRAQAPDTAAIDLAMRELVPRMQANPCGVHGIRGVVLNMALATAAHPRPRQDGDDAGTGRVVAATRACAAALAPAGIRVVALSAVAPRAGAASPAEGDSPLRVTVVGEDTPGWQADFLAAGLAPCMTPSMAPSMAPYRAATAPGGCSQPELLGHAASVLCSDEAGLVTGVGLVVDVGRGV